MIPTIHDPRQALHDPQFSLMGGKVGRCREQAARGDILLAAMRDAGSEISFGEDQGDAAIAAVHTDDYLRFLAEAHDLWSAMDGFGPEVIGNAFPFGEHAARPTGIVGRAGLHMADLSCPIGAGTHEAAHAAAQVALTAAKRVQDGEKAVYALCRPPGHHAMAGRASGYCFLNNASVAAEAAVARGARVAIIDVDVHHGNGTQEVFYDRGDVFFLSLHGDPNVFYPYFWGHAAQTGVGAGEGATLNLPLPLGTGDEAYLKALDQGLKQVEAFSPDVVVVSLGLDAFVNDPYAAMRITTDGFRQVAARIAGLARPVIIVQEGGYICDELGRNLTAFCGEF